jgi:hypothetical protein
MAFVLRQFANDGGPLIVLPREAASFWEGSAPPSNGRVIEARFRWNDDAFATDYDRACDVEEWAAILEVGLSWGLVLGGEDTADGWLQPNAPDTLALVRTAWSDLLSDEEIPKLYEALAEQRWKRLHSGLLITHGDLLLMHAASTGSEVREKEADNPSLVTIGDAMPYHARPGLYSVDLCEVIEPEIIDCVFIRFSRQPPLLCGKSSRYEYVAGT